MSEVPLFFGREAELFGVAHEGEAPAARIGYVFCHPFGEEKLWAHRVFVTFARELARRGHSVLRFDYRGNGDSGGHFSDSSVLSAEADIQCAIDVLKARAELDAVGLVGLRFGASLACRVAEERPDITQLVLWAPIVDGARYMQELLRINLTTQMAVYREIRMNRVALVEHMKAGGTANVDGYEVSLQMHEQLSALTLTSGSKRFAGRCLVTQIERQAVAPEAPELRALSQQYNDGTFEMIQEDPFWREIERFYDRAPNLFAKTLNWLGAV